MNQPLALSPRLKASLALPMISCSVFQGVREQERRQARAAREEASRDVLLTGWRVGSDDLKS